jgi:hypothetical protein
MQRKTKLSFTLLGIFLMMLGGTILFTKAIGSDCPTGTENICITFSH